MPTIPVRNLGQVGVVTDVSPYNLPFNGFSAANNIRFDEGKVRRSPVFRQISDLSIEPRGIFGVQPTSTGSFDTIIVTSDDFQVKEYVNGTILDRNTAFASSDPRPFTFSQLANVTYINREDHVPVFRLPGGTAFADLTNWDSTHRCKSLRPFGDALLALNVTEGLTNYPNRIRFSDLTLANSVPSSWDATDATKSAGFNDLVQMQTAIVDGMSLGNKFIIYSNNEAVLMEFVGGAFIYNFRPLFSDAGVISQNCVVEVESQHYVFGLFDIYRHDGNTKQSISDTKVKNFVYGGMNQSQAELCFVHHNALLNEVMFCYKSGDNLVSFPDTARCNRAAVFNYRTETWSFMDLPNVSSSSVANVDTVVTYNTATSLTYNGISSTYFDQEDSFNKHNLLIGSSDSNNSLTSARIYAVDLADNGSVTAELSTEATKPPFLERVGIDLDEINDKISGYKVIQRILPQVATSNTNDTNVTFSFGASDIPNNTPTYGTNVTFDIAADYKIDSRASGRYLSYKVTFTDNKDFEFSGFDLEVSTTGAR